MRHRLNLTILAVTMIVFSLSCGKSFKIEERFEGISEMSLRVYAMYTFPNEYWEKNITIDIEDMLQREGKKRAWILLNSHAAININDPGTKARCLAVIDEVIQKGVIAYKKCGEFSCSAFIDYDIKKYLESLANGND